jgi:RNA polymerase sigma factor (sigma-70 family)
VTRIGHRELVDLHARHSAALVFYARQWCDNPDDAAQEAMIELSQQSPPPHDPVGWLFTTTRRRAINQARSQRRWDAHHRRAAAERASWFATDSNEFPDEDELRSALQSLDELDRQIVVARIWGELSFTQLAQLVDRPVSFVHRRYHRALTTLGHRLDPDTAEARSHEPSGLE